MGGFLGFHDAFELFRSVPHIFLSKDDSHTQDIDHGNREGADADMQREEGLLDQYEQAGQSGQNNGETGDERLFQGCLLPYPLLTIGHVDEGESQHIAEPCPEQISDCKIWRIHEYGADSCEDFR